MTRGQWTRTLIQDQASAWQAERHRRHRLPDGPCLLVGSGSSFYVALTAAEVGRRLGLSTAAVPAADIVTEPDLTLGGYRSVVVVSRSGRTSEAVWAAAAARTRGRHVVAVTCHADAPLAAEAAEVWAAESAEDHTVVMLQSFTTLVLLLQSAVAEAAGRGAEPWEQHLAAWATFQPHVQAWLDKPTTEAAAPRRTVMLGGGIRAGIAMEGMLKALEMSNQVAYAYVPLEYRHGPWGSLTGDDAVFLLTQRQTGLQDRQLAEDLQKRTPHVVVVGPEGWDGGRPVAGVEAITYPVALDDLWAGALVVTPLQAFAWWWAMASGRDPDVPENLKPVVELDA